MATSYVIQSFQLPSSGYLKETWTNQIIGSTRYYTFSALESAAEDPIVDLENCLLCDIIDTIYYDLDQVPANNKFTQAEADSWGNLAVAKAAWNSIPNIFGQGINYPDTGIYVGAPLTGSFASLGIKRGILAPQWAFGNSTKAYLLAEKTFTYIEYNAYNNAAATVTRLVKVSACGGECTTSNVNIVVPSDIEGWARNTGTVSSGSERVAANLDRGEPTGGFESSELKWWASPDKNLGSYIAKENPTGQSGADGTTAYVGFWRPETETDGAFVELVERISGQSYESVDAAKTWLASNGYSTTYSEKPVATEFFHLDPGSVKSTYGTHVHPDNANTNNYGTTIFDISPANSSYYNSASINRHGSVVDIDHSGLVSKDEYGYVRMVDGVDSKYVSPRMNANSLYLNQTHEGQPELSGLGDTHTFEIWFRSNSVGTCIWSDVDKWTSNGWEYHFAGAQILQVGPFQQVIVNLWNGTECERVVAGSGTFNDGQWHQLVRTYDGTTLKCYLDGVAGGTLNMTFDSPMDDFGFSNSAGWYFEAGPAEATTYNDSIANEFDGDYGIMRAWTRALTATEVAQNFEADRTKYGI